VLTENYITLEINNVFSKMLVHYEWNVAPENFMMNFDIKRF